MAKTPFNIDELRYLQDLAERHANAGRGEKGRLIEGAVTLLGSRDRVYRGLKEIGYSMGRKRRTDHGQSLVSVDDARLVANYVHQSTNGNNKREKPLSHAIDDLWRNGLISTKASPQTYARVMRKHGFHPDQLAQQETHTMMRSLHPNHVWQFDVSLCVLYYMDRGGLSFMDNSEFYKNKPENEERIKKQRVLRYLVTDHYSGAFFLRYYEASGENQTNLFKFLMAAFHEREHPQDPFHGVPNMFVWDAGSANKSHMIQNLLDQLDVKHWAHKPGNPRAKGQVERTHELVERDFESGLFCESFTDIDHLNAEAEKWTRWRNSPQHPFWRHGHGRYAFWNAYIRPEQLRKCPPLELCKTLLEKDPAKRKVRGDLTIRHTVKGCASADYSVEHVQNIRVGDSVDVYINPYREGSIFVIGLNKEGEEVRYECQPIECDTAGFPVDAPVWGEEFKATKDTVTDRHRKEMNQAAYGTDDPKEIKRLRSKKHVAFNGMIKPRMGIEAETVGDYMRRPGTEMGVTSNIHVEPTVLSYVEALKWLRARLGRNLAKMESELVRDTFPDGVPEEALETLLIQLGFEGNAQESCIQA